MMTLRHAAARTGLSATTLRRYIKSGRLPARLIPGRYGPEYVVDEDDLRQSDLLGDDDGAALAAPLDEDDDRDTLHDEAEARPALAGPYAPMTLFGPDGSMPDIVPGLLFRELTMKHEQLLVQFGMLRVTGQQLYEVRQEAERRAEEARAAATELALVRDRHAREIGELKRRLRQAELEIAARDDELARLRSEMRRLEIISRNAATLVAMDEQFARRVQRDPLPETTSHGLHHGIDEDH